MPDASEHFGRQISIKGFSGVGLTGAKRHQKDTDKQICLTLYDQAGVMQELIVPRTRDAEMFQEWLRRYDRYTTAAVPASAMSAGTAETTQIGSGLQPASAVPKRGDAQPFPPFNPNRRVIDERFISKAENR